MWVCQGRGTGFYTLLLLFIIYLLLAFIHYTFKHEKSFLSPPAEVTCGYVRGGGQGHQLSGADVIKALLLFQPTLARIVNAAGGELVRDLNCQESLDVDQVVVDGEPG